MVKELFKYLLILSLVVGCSEKSSQETQTLQQYKGAIIDMHIHAYDSTAGKMMFGMEYINPLTGDKLVAVKNPQQQRDKTFEKFKQYNIVKALVSDGELWFEFLPEEIIISGRNTSVEILRQRYKEGKLHAIGELVHYYGGLSADHPSLDPYFKLAEELDIPISYHVFPGGPPGGIYQMGMSEVRATNANPLQIEEILVRHPKIKFILAHAAWPYLEEVKALMYAHPQLYVEVGVINWILPREEFHNYLKGLVDAGFGKRIMFGTDQMVWPETIDIAIDAINSADFLTLEQKEDIFYYNAAAFLGLSQQQIEKHRSP